MEGISRFIEIYTGKAPAVIEHAKTGNPSVLGGPFRLGVDTILVGAPVRGFRLGDDSILGRVAIRDIVQGLEDPFLSLANWFTVVIDLTQEERARYEKGLRKIISDEKPAHTAYTLRIAGALTAGTGVMSASAPPLEDMSLSASTLPWSAEACSSQKGRKAAGLESGHVSGRIRD